MAQAVALCFLEELALVALNPLASLPSPAARSAPKELKGCELLIHSALHSVHIECKLRARLCKGGQHAGPGLPNVLLSSSLSLFNYFSGIFSPLRADAP